MTNAQATQTAADGGHALTGGNAPADEWSAKMLTYLTPYYVKSRVAYDSESGIATYKPIQVRENLARTDNTWNTRFAGKQLAKISSSGYRLGALNGRFYAVHRLAWVIMVERWPRHFLDHIDGDRLNNRWSNLREANWVENARNRLVVPNKSGIRGVQMIASGRFWARIKVLGRDRYLGSFDTAEGAASAYKSA